MRAGVYDHEMSQKWLDQQSVKSQASEEEQVAPVAFQVGDVIAHSAPWSGYSGKTFSSHVKQSAPYKVRLAAMTGNPLLDPTGDAEVWFCCS